jgi:hypothetical protein
LAGAVALTALAMLPTQVYPARVIYLLPAMIALIGQGLRDLRALGRRRWLNGGVAFLGLAVAWSVALSLVARPALALAQRADRDPDRLLEASTHALGAGPLRVYPEWEFYYAGRALGWSMFRPYGAMTEPQWQQFLGSMDAVITRPAPGEEVLERLASAGLRPTKLAVGAKGDRAVSTFSASPYGEYTLWRTAPKAP